MNLFDESGIVRFNKRVSHQNSLLVFKHINNLSPCINDYVTTKVCTLQDKNKT